MEAYVEAYEDAQLLLADSSQAVWATAWTVTRKSCQQEACWRKPASAVDILSGSRLWKREAYLAQLTSDVPRRKYDLRILLLTNTETGRFMDWNVQVSRDSQDSVFSNFWQISTTSRSGLWTSVIHSADSLFSI